MLPRIYLISDPTRPDRASLDVVVRTAGVHRGAEDLPVEAVRFLAPERFLVHATCRGPEGVREARAQGADYIGLGSVYRSTTKSGPPDPAGLEVLAQTSRVLPTVAIGGTRADRVPDVMAADAYGTAVGQASDPPRVAKEIADLVHVA